MSSKTLGELEEFEVEPTELEENVELEIEENSPIDRINKYTGKTLATSAAGILPLKSIINDNETEDEDMEEESEVDSEVESEIESEINEEDDEDEIEIDEKPQKVEFLSNIQKNIVMGGGDSDDSDDEDEDDDHYLQKFDKEMREDYVKQFHPECMQQNYNEIYNLCKVVRNKDGIIIDELHKTIPIMTKYEKTRILGQRAKQINQGAKPLINIEKKIIDGYLIAQMELQQKVLPFIIRRPLPNGGSEYWNIQDLEMLS